MVKKRSDGAWELPLRPVQASALANARRSQPTRPRLDPQVAPPDADARDLAMLTLGELQARLDELYRTVEKLEALVERVERLEHDAMALDTIDALSARVGRLEARLSRPDPPPDSFADIASRRLRVPGRVEPDEPSEPSDLA